MDIQDLFWITRDIPVSVFSKEDKTSFIIITEYGDKHNFVYQWKDTSYINIDHTDKSYDLLSAHCIESSLKEIEAMSGINIQKVINETLARE